MSPMDRSKYPADWEAISRRVRDQAGNRCQFCGVENGSWGQRNRVTGAFMLLSEYTCLMGDERCVRIVLTVAHLDHDTTNSSDENLRALCQQCHLRWDAKHHAANAAETRRRKKIAVGQLGMEVPV